MKVVKIKGAYKFELDLVVEEGDELYSLDEMRQLLTENFDEAIYEEGVENLQSSLLLDVRGND